MISNEEFYSSDEEDDSNHGLETQDQEPDVESDAGHPNVAKRPQLPVGRDPESREARWRLFCQWDPNGNEILSLAEVDKGLKEVLEPECKVVKPAIDCAFQIARRLSGTVSSYRDDYVDWKEFRAFLEYVERYLELWDIFVQIDADGDRRVTLHEFEAALPLLVRWFGQIPDPLLAFRQMDMDHGGIVRFPEFASWAICLGSEVEATSNRPLNDASSEIVNCQSQNDNAPSTGSNSKPISKRYGTPCDADTWDVHSLEGLWDSQTGALRISAGGRVVWPSGDKAHLAVTGKNEAHLKLTDGREFVANVIGREELRWNDGDVWSRASKQLGSGFQPPPRVPVKAVAKVRTVPVAGDVTGRMQADRLHKWQAAQEAWKDSAWLKVGGSEGQRPKPVRASQAPKAPTSGWGWNCSQCQSLNAPWRPTCNNDACGASRPRRKQSSKKVQSNSAKTKVSKDDSNIATAAFVMGTALSAGRLPQSAGRWPARTQSAPRSGRSTQGPSPFRSAVESRQYEFGAGAKAADLSNPPMYY